MYQYLRRGCCDTFLTAGFLHRTLNMEISWHSLSILACVTKKYISSILENKSEREGWEDDLSSESRGKIKLVLLMLLMLDIKDSPVSLLLAEREARGSTVMSCRYLKSWACLKEQSMSSNSLSSL